MSYTNKGGIINNCLDSNDCPFCRLCTWIKGQGLAASREFVPATQMLRALDAKVRIDILLQGGYQLLDQNWPSSNL